MCYIPFVLHWFRELLFKPLASVYHVHNQDKCNCRIYTICAAVSVFYVYSRLSVSTKSEVRLIYALLKIIPICLLFSVSSSLTICLTSVFAMIIIGLLSGYLKWKNMYIVSCQLTHRAKECSIIYHCLCFDTVSSGSKSNSYSVNCSGQSPLTGVE